MSSLMHVSQRADHLVLSYPIWIGLTLLLVAAALAAYAIRARRRLRGIGAVSVATIVAAWAGLYFATFTATLTPDAGSVYAFLRYDHAVRWQDATDIYLEQRGNGSDWHIMVLDRQQRAFDFNVADLSIEDRDRVMAYMVDLIPESAFSRSPALLKRHAPQGPRPVGWFSDQQT